MSPGVWQLLALALIATCIAGLVIYAARLDGRGSHTIRSVRLRAADPFAGEDDPAYRHDPYGEKYIGRLTAGDGPDLDALPVGTGWFPALPDDEPADITGVQPADVRYLGKTSGEYVDELFKDAETQDAEVTS